MCSATNIEFPFEIQSVDAVTNAELMKFFPCFDNGLVLIGPKKYAFPYALSKDVEKLYNFQSRPDDIWIVTYPRSGTTITQEMVWMITNDSDFAGGQAEILAKRSPFFEFHALMSHEVPTRTEHESVDDPEKSKKVYGHFANAYEALKNMPSPRIIKTHMPLSLLPPSIAEVGAKVIYVARNPKDAVVSYYHFCTWGMVVRFIGDFPRFWDYYERDQTMSSPHIEHVVEGWERRDDPNFLFLFYEDIINDMPSTISKVARFLDKSISDADNQRLAEHLNIENFRKNPAVNLDHLVKLGLKKEDDSPFIRKGKSSADGWPEEFTPKLIERFEAWITNFYAKTAFRFPEF